MTEPKSAPESAGTPTESGHGAKSPYDGPTEAFPPSRPQLTSDVPRTDEELGLDLGPEIPAHRPAGFTSEPATSAFSATEPVTAPAYAYASIPPAPAQPEPTEKIGRKGRHDFENRRGTVDLGLLLLRCMIGATFVYHGLQKLTTWFHGQGLDGTRTAMESSGWKQPTLATIMVISGEIGGGTLLILGLFTPLAAGAVLAVIIDAWLWKQSMSAGFQYNARVPGGVEYETVLGVGAAALILIGPGRLSFDRNRGWATHPRFGSFLALLAAVAAAIGTWIWLHGGNPLG